MTNGLSLVASEEGRAVTAAANQQSEVETGVVIKVLIKTDFCFSFLPQNQTEFSILKPYLSLV